MKADNVLYLEHGKPMVFGKDKSKGIRLNGLKPEVVEIGKDCQIDDLLTHDESRRGADAGVSAEPLRPRHAPDAVKPFPEPVGVFRERPQADLRGDCSTAASRTPIAKKGKGKIEDLFKAEDVWTVE